MERSIVCKSCHCPVFCEELEERSGQGVRLGFVYTNGNSSVIQMLFNSSSKSGKLFDINRASTLAFRAIGSCKDVEHFRSTKALGQAGLVRKHQTNSRCMEWTMPMNKGTGKRGHIVADTLLPTQMFPRLPARATFVADTNFVSATQKLFLILFRNILCPQQMFPSLRVQGNVMSNNVSSFATALIPPLLARKRIG